MEKWRKKHYRQAKTTAFDSYVTFFVTMLWLSISITAFVVIVFF